MRRLDMRRLGVLLLLVLGPGLVLAHAGHNESGMEQAEAIINAEIPCESLSEEQLEYLGDYYMEQMHPGEEHDRMDAMMGGEGSDSLRAMHIMMARKLYCGEGEMMGSGMMGGHGRHHKKGGEMHSGGSGMMGGTMMGGFGLFGLGLVWLVFVALAAFVFGVVFWWTRRLVERK